MTLVSFFSAQTTYITAYLKLIIIWLERESNTHHPHANAQLSYSLTRMFKVDCKAAVEQGQRPTGRRPPSNDQANRRLVTDLLNKKTNSLYGWLLVYMLSLMLRRSEEEMLHRFILVSQNLGLLWRGEKEIYRGILNVDKLGGFSGHQTLKRCQDNFFDLNHCFQPAIH